MAQYGAFSVFQRVTADSLNALIPQVYRKQTSTTRPSTITRTDDPELVVPLNVGSSLVEFYIKYGTTAAAGLASSWGMTATVSSTTRVTQGLGSTASPITAIAQDVTPSGTNFSTRQTVSAYATGVPYGHRASVGASVWLYEWGIVDVTAAGNASFQWAQTVSTVDNTVVTAGSFARVTQLA